MKIADRSPLEVVAMPTKDELMQRIRELEEENDELQDQLDHQSAFCVEDSVIRAGRVTVL